MHRCCKYDIHEHGSWSFLLFNLGHCCVCLCGFFQLFLLLSHYHIIPFLASGRTFANARRVENKAVGLYFGTTSKHSPQHTRQQRHPRSHSILLLQVSPFPWHCKLPTAPVVIDETVHTLLLQTDCSASFVFAHAYVTAVLPHVHNQSTKLAHTLQLICLFAGI